jgi:hypothetical protein
MGVKIVPHPETGTETGTETETGTRSTPSTLSTHSTLKNGAPKGPAELMIRGVRCYGATVVGSEVSLSSTEP